jgi:hypothetical protein
MTKLKNEMLRDKVVHELGMEGTRFRVLITATVADFLINEVKFISE